MLFQCRIVVLDQQGLAFDPDEDKEEVLLKQIEDGVKNWFSFHKYDEEEHKSPFTLSVQNINDDLSQSLLFEPKKGENSSVSFNSK